MLLKTVRAPCVISSRYMLGTVRYIGYDFIRSLVDIGDSTTDDPYFAPQPKLTIITDKPVKGNVIEALRKLPSVRSVIVY